MAIYIPDPDLLSATSAASIPFHILFLKQSETITAEFVYNYYTRDEGSSEVTTLSGLDYLTDQYRFIVENYEKGVYPRQINLRIAGGGSYPVETLSAETIKTAYNSGQIVFEDAPFSTRISSVIVNDTSIDETFYQTSLATGGTPTSSETQNFLYTAGLQAAGYGFSNSQTEEEIALQYEKEIKAVNLGISLNDLFVADFVKTSERWQASAYADEFASVVDQASEVQERVRDDIASDPYMLTESDIDIAIRPIQTVSVNYTDLDLSSGTSSYEALLGFLGIDSATSVVGFIVEKYGEQIDGTNLVYDPFIVEGITSANADILDNMVRYGGVYSYKLRTVYKTIIITPRESGEEGFEGFDVSTVLLASTGVSTTVRCIESAPPLPPNNLSFQQTISGLYIRWNFPINTTKDIKRFQVFRRSSIEESFRLISEINFDQSTYPYTSGESVPEGITIRSNGPIKHFLDTEFNSINSDYIYAVCCIDAHGLSSGYSDQFRVRFDRLIGKIIITRVSTEGAPKPYPNVNILEDLFSDVIKDSGHSRIRVYFDPEYTDILKDGKSLSLISKSSAGSVAYKICLTELNLNKSQNIDILINDTGFGTTTIPVSIGRFYTAD